MRNRRWIPGLVAIGLVAVWAWLPAMSARAALSYTEVARLTAPTPTSNAAFGQAVALRGDWLAVGEPNANEGAGAVHLFHRVGLSWEHVATLTADDGAANDHFGQALALTDAFLAVGAPDADLGENEDAGAVYLFAYAQSQWQLAQKLSAPSVTAGDRFGASLALDDGTLVVGAPQFDQPNNNAGAVFVFTQGDDGSWAHQVTLTAADGKSGDRLGTAVALFGDRVAAGAPLANAPATDAGRVYLFLRQGSTWTQEAAFSPADAAKDDRFGSSVALSNGVLAVGAPGADASNAADVGAVYIYSLADQQWTLQARLSPDDAQAGDAFGQAVSLDSGLALIGAPQAGGGVGAAYVFTAEGEQWVQQARLRPNSAVSGDEAGAAIALDAGWLALGAPEGGAGAVSLFAPEQARAVVHLLSAQGLLVRPRDILFPPTIPLGVDVTVQAEEQTWTVANLTGLSLDWHVTLSATDFTDGRGNSIPVSNFKVQMGAQDITTVSGSSPPTSRVTSATALSPEGVTLLAATNGAGQGVYDFVPHFSLIVPAGTAEGRYSTTVLVTITAGP